MNKTFLYDAEGRDLMQNSFDLFTIRTAETTNVVLRRLTFLSLLPGGISAIVCLFGMNFQPPFAESLAAFCVIVGAIFVMALTGIVVGRWRKWV